MEQLKVSRRAYEALVSKMAYRAYFIPTGQGKGPLRVDTLVSLEPLPAEESICVLERFGKEAPTPTPTH